MILTKTKIKTNVKELFKFFSKPKNFEQIYPKELQLKILKAPEELKNGDEITLLITLFGQRFRWKLRIKSFNPPKEIVYEALVSPFKSWIHTLKLSPLDENTLLEDKIDFSTYFPISNIFSKFLIKRVLNYKNEALRKYFGEPLQPLYKDSFRIGLFQGTFISCIMVLLALILNFPLPFNTSLDILFALISFFLLWFFTHDLAHLAVGAIVGVKFRYYFLGLSNIILIKGFPEALKFMPMVLGLKVDKILSRASKKGLASMYLSGPLASIFIPFLVPLWILFKDSSNLSGLITLILSLFNLTFSLYFSPKVGCIAKALRVISVKESSKR
ncbi:MAG: hypothetical protein QXX95_08350 [Nitrososphaerales archaeon]